MGVSGSLGAAVTGFMMFGSFGRVFEGAVVRAGEGKGKEGEDEGLGKSIYDGRQLGRRIKDWDKVGRWVLDCSG